MYSDIRKRTKVKETMFDIKYQPPRARVPGRHGYLKHLLTTHVPQTTRNYSVQVIQSFFIVSIRTT